MVCVFSAFAAVCDTCPGFFSSSIFERVIFRHQKNNARQYESRKKSLHFPGWDQSFGWEKSQNNPSALLRHAASTPNSARIRLIYYMLIKM